MVDLAEGDRDAFDRVFSALWPILRAVSRRMLGQVVDADDAAQQALLKLFAQASTFDSAQDVLPWALTFAINECRTLRNRARRRPTLIVDDINLSGISCPEQMLIEQDLLDALQVAGAKLDPKDRQALGLEAACESLPQPTLRKRRQRALCRLRLAWRKLYGTV